MTGRTNSGSRWLAGSWSALCARDAEDDTQQTQPRSPAVPISWREVSSRSVVSPRLRPRPRLRHPVNHLRIRLFQSRINPLPTTSRRSIKTVASHKSNSKHGPCVPLARLRNVPTSYVRGGTGHERFGIVMAGGTMVSSLLSRCRECHPTNSNALSRIRRGLARARSPALDPYLYRRFEIALDESIGMTGRVKVSSLRSTCRGRHPTDATPLASCRYIPIS